MALVFFIDYFWDVSTETKVIFIEKYFKYYLMFWFVLSGTARLILINKTFIS